METPTTEQWEWMRLAYASLQPRNNAEWLRIVAELNRDIERYLAFVDIARS